MAQQGVQKKSGIRIGNEVGSTGLEWAPGGYITEETNKRLAGSKAMAVFKEMGDNDPVVGGSLYAIDSIVRQVPWHVEQEEASEEDVQFLEECMEDMHLSWPETISEIMSELQYGYSFHEIVYKVRRGYQREEVDVKRAKKLKDTTETKRSSRRPAASSRFDDGKVGWAGFPIRSQDSLEEWVFDEFGNPVAFGQRAAPYYERVDVPFSKGLLFRTRVYKENPEGRSLLRSAYRPWYFKKRIEEIEGTGIERDLAGFPVFNVPMRWMSTEATADEKAYVAELQRVAANIRRDKMEYLMIPNAYDEAGNKLVEFSLMSSGGARTFDTTAIVQRYDQRIAMSMLTDFILLGHDKVGSFALSSDKTDIFAVALGTVLDNVQEVFNRYAIPRLWRMNGWKEENLPRLKHGDLDDRDLASLGSYLSVLQQIGMQLFPDEDLEKQLREVAHLTEKSEETKQLQEEQKQQQMEQMQQQFGGMGDAQGQDGGDQGDELRFTDDEGSAYGSQQSAGGSQSGTGQGGNQGGYPRPQRFNQQSQ